MGEVRIKLDEKHVYRVLFAFAPDDTPVLLLAGNKAAKGSTWYDENVPEADNRFDMYLRAVAKARSEQTR